MPQWWNITWTVTVAGGLAVAIAGAIIIGAATGTWKWLRRRFFPPKVEPTTIKSLPDGLSIKTEQPLDVRVTPTSEPKAPTDALYLLGLLCHSEERQLRHCTEKPEHVEIDEMAFYHKTQRLEADRWLIAFHEMQNRSWLTPDGPELHKPSGAGLAASQNAGNPDPYKGPPPTFGLTEREAKLLSSAFAADKPIRKLIVGEGTIIRAGKFHPGKDEIPQYTEAVEGLERKGHVGPWVGKSDSQTYPLTVSGLALAKRLPAPERIPDVAGRNYGGLSETAADLLWEAFNADQLITFKYPEIRPIYPIPAHRIILIGDEPLFKIEEAEKATRLENGILELERRGLARREGSGAYRLTEQGLRMGEMIADDLEPAETPPLIIIEDGLDRGFTREDLEGEMRNAP